MPAHLAAAAPWLKSPGAGASSWPAPVGPSRVWLRAHSNIQGGELMHGGRESGLLAVFGQWLWLFATKINDDNNGRVVIGARPSNLLTV